MNELHAADFAVRLQAGSEGLRRTGSGIDGVGHGRGHGRDAHGTFRTGQSRGFLAVDAVFGLMIIAAVTVALIGTVNHERSAELNLSDSRGALHLAEHALLNLQYNQPLPPVTGGTQVSIHPATGGTAPAGYAWATVDANVHGHHRSLTGVVPAGSIPHQESK